MAKNKQELLNSQFASRRNRKTKIAAQSELLAPVGNFEMLHSAIDAGADAVYLGLNEFTMRAGAKNFTINDLKKVHSSEP